MNYRRLADLVHAVHWIWIVVLVSGGLAQWLLPVLRPVFLAIILTTCISQILWGRCPLTLLEESLRVKAGEDVIVRESFLIRAIRRRFGLEVPPWVITAQMVVLTIVTVYLAFTGHLDTPSAPH